MTCVRYVRLLCPSSKLEKCIWRDLFSFFSFKIPCIWRDTATAFNLSWPDSCMRLSSKQQTKQKSCLFFELIHRNKKRSSATEKEVFIFCQPLLGLSPAGLGLAHRSAKGLILWKCPCCVTMAHWIPSSAHTHALLCVPKNTAHDQALMLTPHRVLTQDIKKTLLNSHFGTRAK